MSRPVLVCASANPAKVAEIEALLDGVVDLLPRPASLGDVVEDAPDLVGNARLKAQAVCAATGRPAVADDTGLEVDALDGRPGVHSARFAGPAADAEANIDLLLAELGDLPLEQRTARFRTVALVVTPGGEELVCHGTAEGTIRGARSGRAGFGYDPVFEPTAGDGRTFSEMSAEEKHQISHRGAAFGALAAAIAEHPELLEGPAPTD